jgi:3-dehydrosphinganine reductase
MSFKDKQTLITGGSSGIGKATAKQLAAAGAHVAIIGRDQAKIDAALEEIRASAGHHAGQIIAGYAADVSRYPQVARVVRELAAANRAPDYLFNFAGMAHPGYFQDLPLSVFRQTMDTNFFGIVNVCKATVPLMIARGRGHIVNMSSAAGFMGVFGYSAYGASKWAVFGFSEVLRSEMKPYGIRVSVVFPSDVDTPQLHEENKVKPAETRAIGSTGKVLSADEVARTVLRQVARGRFIIVVGSEARLAYLARRLLGGDMQLILDGMVRSAQRRAGGPRRVDWDQACRQLDEACSDE